MRRADVIFPNQVAAGNDFNQMADELVNSVAVVAAVSWVALTAGGMALYHHLQARGVTGNDGGSYGEIEVDSTHETVDLFERKISEQGDRFDSSNGILVGVLGAQVAVFVFYADMFANTLHDKPNFLLLVVLATSLAGLFVSGFVLRASDYRQAPRPDVFAMVARLQGLDEARRVAVQDMREAYDENSNALRSRQRGITWSLIIAIVSLLLGLAVEFAE